MAAMTVVEVVQVVEVVALVEGVALVKVLGGVLMTLSIFEIISYILF